MPSKPPTYEDESSSPSLIGAKGSETQGRSREATSERSEEQNRGSMNKNRLRGAKGGRAGKWPQSPNRSKPGSVKSAIVRGKTSGISGEICTVPRSNPWLSPTARGAERDAEVSSGHSSDEGRESGRSEGPNGVPKRAQARRGQVSWTLP